ncbi:MAG: hypothetical protein WDN75_05125 [Bacteroidota bacterium]
MDIHPSDRHVSLWVVNAGANGTPVSYSVNQVYKNKTRDEQGNEVIEYVDNLGRTILKRVQVVTGTPAVNDANYASTYYIYDDFGSLVCVIPPEATSRLAAEYFQSGATDATKDAFLKRWAFRYAYDSRVRMIQKQVPGATPVYMVYDDRDRLIFSQDGNQRAVNKWSYIQYDVLNRPVITGLYTHGSAVDQATMTTYVRSWMTTFYETLNIGTTHGYTNNMFSSSNLTQVVLKY